ncbi:hypothetical protein [Bradyrhizobium canariense]|uniref:RDD family protein n=1 Tax=Bradyrhizobium canariense TaxID=255045 RepID=A0A1X3GAV4_9BRAD|nr:hypothetical protein [Bradyrhizobium canariense]OSI69917.1 hypothetical protein BSZ22_15830 [Bradyrhizobium canariense]OSI74939.1 hypothetical protein BSZ23_32115 [Bradyrhizobium canariense]OSI83435.1 hypothetical protein BSZ24_36625 [Bradyrhizobium canariense]OSI86582.1 hypothetical protein BSZ25_30690 [Bradyrhizobium canariense]OSI98459.1 hypothetical protein BSZ16_31745 [Bradyrhizobium canariense]
MKLRIIELPDDHAFLSPVRSLVDGVFKIIGWLALSATIQVAAEATRSALLWSLCLTGYFMIAFYIQTFFDWLTHGKLPGMATSIRDVRPGQGSRFGFVRLLSRIAVPAVGIAIWFALILAMQSTIEKSASLIVDFQKSSKK